MKISHIEHIGIAVESIEAVLPYFENVLGLKCYNIEVVEDQKVKTAFLKCGEVKLELLEPTSPESTIAKYIEKKGQGMHHMAFCIEDGVANALAEAEAAGIRLIDKAPRKGAENLNIAFLHPLLFLSFKRIGVVRVRYHPETGQTDGNNGHKQPRQYKMVHKDR